MMSQRSSPTASRMRCSSRLRDHPASSTSYSRPMPRRRKLPFVKRRDTLGTTHHEAGPLWMGMDPASSVTNTDTRFHHVANAYVAGPALFPSLGSPNPMLTGTALTRRLGNALKRPQPQPSAGFQLLFDGVSTAGWTMNTIVNQPGRDYPGTFHLVDAGLESDPGTDLGLFYTKVPFAITC